MINNRKSKNKIVIIHYRPLELYPPIMNMLEFFSKHFAEKTFIYVFTTKKNADIFNFEIENIILKKSILPSETANNKLSNLFFYLKFYFATFLKILALRPNKLLYFETISSLPALLYSSFTGKKCELLIHYHEYTSKKEYKNGMALTRLLHLWEKRVYKKATWISHTNQDRINRFLKDNKIALRKDQVYILPNFPPQKWGKKASVKEIKSPLRLIYLGNLTTKSMHIEKVCDWIIDREGEVTLDIYSLNIGNDVLALLERINSSYIQFKGKLPYHSIPEILINYDVGLVLYNGNSLNFVYNAPNKIFEYYACNLDVWFSDDLLSSYEYIQENAYPKILKIDFRNMDKFDWRAATSRKGLNYQPSPFFCEKVLPTLAEKLF